MNVKSFDELVKTKIHPFGHIIILFDKFADMPLRQLYGECDEVYGALNELHRFDEDATVFDAANEIFKGYTPLGSKDHDYSEKDLEAARMLFYLVVAVVKNIQYHNSTLLTNIDFSVSLNHLQDFADYYRSGNPAPLDEGRYDINGSRSCYDALFRAFIRELDGDMDIEWFPAGLPVIGQRDFFYMKKAVVLLNTFYRIIVIPLIASKDRDFVGKVKEQNL